MNVSDQDRRALFVRLEALLGEPEASTLMELLPPVGWSDVARRSDVAEVRGEIAEVRGEIVELRGEIAELRGEMRLLLPKLYAANVATMIGISGLVLAAVALG